MVLGLLEREKPHILDWNSRPIKLHECQINGILAIVLNLSWLLNENTIG